jgi:hypothetical protein
VRVAGGGTATGATLSDGWAVRGRAVRSGTAGAFVTRATGEATGRPVRSGDASGATVSTGAAAAGHALDAPVLARRRREVNDLTLTGAL